MDDKNLQDMLDKIEVPEPSNESKNRAIANAREEFKKSEKKSQGFESSNRQTFRTNKKWSFDMSKFNIRHLAGTTAIVLAVSVVLTSDYSPLGSTKKDGQEVELVDSVKVGSRKELKLEEKIANYGQIKADSKGNEDSYASAPMAGVAPPPPTYVGSNDRVNNIAALGGESTEAISSAPTRQKLKGIAKKKVMSSDFARGIVVSAPAPQMMYEMEGGGAFADDAVTAPTEEIGRDKFEDLESNPIKLVKEEPVSTFSIDVDTASYSFARKKLNQGVLPQKDAIRIEEMINYFDYDYFIPEDKSEPFKPTISVFETPWNAETKLMHVGIKGYDLQETEKPRSNLVFLLDVSGSMNAADKLPLLKNSFKMMVDNLDENDTVSIVVYAGAAGTVLEPTKISEKGKILAALERLSAGGSTAGGEGIRQAYALAEANFDKNGVNRVILATDGDFNVGIRNKEELKDFVERKRKSGVFLSVLGFGQGNYNDALMQELAQNGNGNAAYIDSLNEARKVLVDESSGTLFTIAKDVKLQVEFNPNVISEYRLIGYESRMLKREDFNNDKVDAGEIGAGHAVTAIYEITPKGSSAQLVDDLRYGEEEEVKEEGKGGEYAFLKIRYKLPDVDKSTLTTRPITVADEGVEVNVEAKFAAAVAAFGQLLKDDSHIGDFTYDDVIKLALSAKGNDKFGYRSEFINLVRLAKSASAMRTQPNGQLHQRLDYHR